MRETPTTGAAFRAAGRVQGVGFRWFGCTVAEELGVTGWIRNRPDGAVEGEAFGTPDILDIFFARLRQGPPSGRVDQLERTTITRSEALERFETRW